MYLSILKVQFKKKLRRTYQITLMRCFCMFFFFFCFCFFFFVVVVFISFIKAYVVGTHMPL